MNGKTIFRVCKDKNNPYVILNKKFLNDVELSWKAKGILAYLLSLPDDWKIYMDEIVKHSTDGKESLQSGIRELIDKGYIERKQVRDEKGRMQGYTYTVYEVSTRNGFPADGVSSNGKTTLTNNELTNNDVTNKKEIYVNLTVDGNPYLEIYNNYFQNKFNKPHMRVTNKQLIDIEEKIGILESYDIDLEEWERAVKEHFENLPKSNNGNILAFLKAAARYFEIDLERIMERGY